MALRPCEHSALTLMALCNIIISDVLLKDKNIFGTKHVSFDTFCTYIKENSIKEAPAFSEEGEDIDPYNKIASPDDIDKHFSDIVEEPVSVEGTDTQICYFGITTTYNWLYNVYQKEK